MSDYTPQFCLYVIQNTKNGKVYIGKTSRGVKTRWSEHRKKLRGNYHHNHHLQAAWNKYGEKAFKFRILEYCDIEHVNAREMHHIRIYREKDMCYNLTDGGDGTINPSAETRRRIGDAHRGKGTMLGKHHTEETKRKISEANKNISDEYRKWLSESRKGKLHSEETKRKISEANKGRRMSEAERLSRSGKIPYNKGKTPSDETRRRMSESGKARVAREREERKRKEQENKNGDS